MPVNERSLIGQEVAGYQVEEIIGKGGMAVVYLATDPRLSRRVALKILHPVLSTDDRFRQRFVLESRTVAGIDHPNIIPIYEANADGELLYIAMRYVDGMDLRRLFMDRGPLEISQVNRIFAQVAAALDTAHAHDLIHRDIKPANILVAGGTNAEHVYLTDFGITKHRTSISGLTQTDQFIGTPRYMAPEQINKDTIDGRCDQYALACVVYEAMAGRLPFQRDNDIALLWAHLAEAPAPLSSLRPELPLEVDGVMARALAKSPDQRFASCGEFVAELRDAIGGRSTGTFSMPVGSPVAPPVAPPTASPIGAPVAADPVPQSWPGSPVTGPSAGTPTVPVAAPPKARGGRKGILIGASAAVAVIVAAAAVLSIMLRGTGEIEWARYDGSKAAPLRFDYPQDWTTKTHADLFTVASPHGTEFERLFVTPVSADWTETNRLLRADPATATGLYVQVLDTLDPNAQAQELQETLQSSMPGGVSITSGVVQVSVGGRPAVRIEGALADPQGGGRLDFVGYAIDRQGAAALLVYFCAPNTCQDTVAQRIAGSVDLLPG
ncbi:serine/threonine-protein kinase [Spongiactinospora sp. TRM90649]|uniref:serine/threonine-protein kinase n=1 Tax=Spongiactinospora sp. TRM90649 TaxID=3031114 RepID=UPI0023FA144E|nr:serine/threonine-protein kinase [Spongiactinospora sp. TRM90649]MDF5755706.1 serine/threonine-protein kinase [Spongiactinospora sp. TRM90649]